MNVNSYMKLLVPIEDVSSEPDSVFSVLSIEQSINVHLDSEE